MAKEKKRTGEGVSVLRFLDEHRLEHSPAHYAFAHRYLFGDDAILATQVTAIIDGGVRISPQEVARLAPPQAEDATETAVPQLDRMTLRVLDIIGDALDATGDLNRDLVKASASLLAADAPNIRAIVTAMLDRTTRAESSLADATQQAQRLREELNVVRSEASRDRLTGLTNRAAMEDHLAAASTHMPACSVAMVDIDHFKAINDTHGHGVGDRVLKAVASTLRETCAPHIVARWGGEEFVVLLENVPAASGREIVDRARIALASKRLKLRENDAPLGIITFSAGVASLAARDGAAAIDAADALLYEAKRAGRNRVLTERVPIRA
ncbi:MAG: GGDEF domain-containing protein [Sphingomonas sp.]